MKLAITSDKELVEQMWELRGILYNVASYMEKYFENKEKKGVDKK